MIGLCCYNHLSLPYRMAADNVLILKNVLYEIKAVAERLVFKRLAHPSVGLKVLRAGKVVSALHLEAVLLTLIYARSFDAKVHILYNFIYFKYYENKLINS